MVMVNHRLGIGGNMITQDQWDRYNGKNGEEGVRGKYDEDFENPFCVYVRVGGTHGCCGGQEVAQQMEEVNKMMLFLNQEPEYKAPSTLPPLPILPSPPSHILPSLSLLVAYSVNSKPCARGLGILYIASSMTSGRTEAKLTSAPSPTALYLRSSTAARRPALPRTSKPPRLSPCPAMLC